MTTSFDQAFDFLYSIDEIGMNPKMEQDVRDYMHSNVLFPKRYKVRNKVYFIMIKTTARTMEEFKNHKKSQEGGAEFVSAAKQQQNELLNTLNEQRDGWYEGVVDFKRVIVNPTNGKCVYIDTRFIAQCKAISAADCFNRIIDHLSQRVDDRSQFPSVKGKNFQYRFLGDAPQLS
ncbi:MAG: hypothetical protein HUK07_07520 [Bacteroidaceae bacterium]|nr:hypothetical protein [Bacteroidaceae bacterium]